ncbi:MAG TPA: hypothetical protein VEI94_12855 [Candidatus Bathyarchaeia archaeon]|nr:hypothetical protein [Candidatus Bathyarchaeia archaeon]
MGGMPDLIIKTPFLRMLDQASRWENLPYNRIIADLRSGENLVDLAKRYGLRIDPDEERHIRVDWLNETGQGWWQSPYPQPVAELVRAAMIKLTELARDTGRPVDSYWICYPPDGDAEEYGGQGGASQEDPSQEQPVEIDIAVSDKQLTLLLQTPDPRYEVAEYEDDPTVWVTRVVDGCVKTRPNRVPKGQGPGSPSESY